MITNLYNLNYKMSLLTSIGTLVIVNELILSVIHHRVKPVQKTQSFIHKVFKKNINGVIFN